MDGNGVKGHRFERLGIFMKETEAPTKLLNSLSPKSVKR